MGNLFFYFMKKKNEINKCFELKIQIKRINKRHLKFSKILKKKREETQTNIVESNISYAT